MKNIAKLAAALAGLFSLAMGLLAWFAPIKVGEIVGLAGQN